MAREKYIVTEKLVGETPLEALEKARVTHNISTETPMAYAGRLDPMASGKLLILVGDECKNQTVYHSLDKEYIVELLFGVSSDTGDVLGRLTMHTETQTLYSEAIKRTLFKLKGTITLPYPNFSAKTVRGKPLHMWTLAEKLDEIEIPTKESLIHTLNYIQLRTVTKQEILTTVREKIETIPPVTDPRKALGADFRREDVRKDWDTFEQSGSDTYQILTFSCIASSGTYMRTLCEEIAKNLGTTGLAYSIHRTKIGKYRKIIGPFGIWIKKY